MPTTSPTAPSLIALPGDPVSHAAKRALELDPSQFTKPDQVFEALADHANDLESARDAAVWQSEERLRMLNDERDRATALAARVDELIEKAARAEERLRMERLKTAHLEARAKILDDENRQLRRKVNSGTNDAAAVEVLREIIDRLGDISDYECEGCEEGYREADSTLCAACIGANERFAEES